MSSTRKVAAGYRLIFGYLGIFLTVIGATCLLPLFILIYKPEEAQYACDFYLPGIATIVLGIGLSLLITRREKAQLAKHQDSILLVLIWLCAVLFGAVPFMLRGLSFAGGAHFDGEPMSFTDAVFEATSGYSTTGLTRFDYGDQAAFNCFVFYRSLIQFIGGIGLVLIVASAISDRYGLKLYVAEGHGDRLMPNLAKSARVILSIYVGYAVLGTFAYMAAGMNWFDALNHSFSALSTGGFSTYKDSLADPKLLASLRWGESSLIAVEVISMLLMIAGSTNFLLHLFLFKGRIKQIFKDCEVHFFLILMVIFVPLLTVSIFLHMQACPDPLAPADGWQAFRYGIFSFVTASTTTGFANVADLTRLGEASLLIIIAMMFIGGGMGSTAGAVKQYRFVIALKTTFWSIRDRAAPKHLLHPRYVYRTGEVREVTPEMSYEAFGFILLSVIVDVVGSILVIVLGTKNGITISQGFFEFTSALALTGLTRLDASLATPGVNWVLTVGMFAGRLEIIPIYFAFYRMMRDLLRKETV